MKTHVDTGSIIQTTKVKYECSFFRALFKNLQFFYFIDYGDWWRLSLWGKCVFLVGELH